MCDNDAVCANLNRNVTIKEENGIKSVVFTDFEVNDFKNNYLDTPRYLSTASNTLPRDLKFFFN